MFGDAKNVPEITVVATHTGKIHQILHLEIYFM